MEGLDRLLAPVAFSLSHSLFRGYLKSESVTVPAPKELDLLVAIELLVGEKGLGRVEVRRGIE